MWNKKDRSEYIGVILAAGNGTRMGELGQYYPKSILPLCNKPLIEYQIELMLDLGIREVVILVGHKGFEIPNVLGDGRKFGMRFHFVEQNKMLGIAHALGQLEPYIDRPFMLFLGDIFFVPRDLEGMFCMFEEQRSGGVLACKIENDQEAIHRNFSVHLDDDGFVTRVVEKERHAHNRLKGVGLYLFDLAIFNSIRRTPRTALRDEYEITDAIQILIDDGYPVRAAYVTDDDINMTTPQDVHGANMKVLQRQGKDCLIGERCIINPGTKIINSIIGSDVIVDYPITIKNTVIFSHTKLWSQIDIDNSIITPDAIVNFNLRNNEDSR